MSQMLCLVVWKDKTRTVKLVFFILYLCVRCVEVVMEKSFLFPDIFVLQPPARHIF